MYWLMNGSLGETTKRRPMPPLASTAKSSPCDVAGLVEMPVLLRALGFDLNQRTRRAPCILHTGSNPTAFSWTDDGRWHCFSCERGGDKIALVRAVRSCSFPEAVDFLASLAGVEYSPSPVSAHEFERARVARVQARRNARTLVDAEFSVWRDARDNLLSLVALRRNAGARLLAIAGGATPRFPGEAEIAWEVLKIVADGMARADTAYCLVSFAAPIERYAFILHPERREEMIEAALERGYVADEKGYRFEVAI
jgi:hypothetical protein